MWFKSIPKRTAVGLSPVSYTFAGVILFICLFVVVVVVVVSHVVQVHPEKDLSRVVPSKLYVCRCYFVCLFVCGCFVV